MPTAQTVREFMAETTGQTFVELFTLEAEGFPTGYMADHVDHVVSRGQTYTAVGITYNPADKSGKELSSPSITISNVTRDLVKEVRQDSEPTIKVELVSLARPDVVEETAGPYEVAGTTYTVSGLRVELDVAKIFDEQFPYGSYIPSYFPAIFAA